MILIPNALNIWDPTIIYNIQQTLGEIFWASMSLNQKSVRLMAF